MSAQCARHAPRPPLSGAAYLRRLPGDRGTHVPPTIEYRYPIWRCTAVAGGPAARCAGADDRGKNGALVDGSGRPPTLAGARYRRSVGARTASKRRRAAGRPPKTAAGSHLLRCRCACGCHAPWVRTAPPRDSALCLVAAALLARFPMVCKCAGTGIVPKHPSHIRGLARRDDRTQQTRATDEQCDQGADA